MPILKSLKGLDWPALSVELRRQMSARKGTLWATALTLLGLASQAGAQVVPEPGDVLRLTRTDGQTTTGVLDRLSPSGVTLSLGSGEAFTVAHADIERAERSLGEHRNFARNFTLTMGATTFGLAFISWATFVKPSTYREYAAETRTQAFFLGMAGGLLIGFPAGIILGSVLKEERWEATTLAPPPSSQWQLTPWVAPTGLGVAVKLRR